ncbi:ankyrin repeat domain-containing protein [Prosthecobacter sp.]|uniref:ankyrin repeat domain-containing protein n=1 Tax=Prosthecobacter sp. TaxID=1965333 RepID=UPI0037844C13
MQKRFITTSALAIGVALLAITLTRPRSQSSHVSESRMKAFRLLTQEMTETIHRQHRSEFLAMYNAFKPHESQRAEYEQTLVFAAVGVYDQFFIDFVVASGADINCRNERGQTCLEAVARRSDEMDAAEQLYHLAQLGLNVSQPDNHGETLGHYAARNNRAGLLLCLPDKFKSLIDAQNSLGQTPLMICAESGIVNAAAALLHKGASRTLRDREGRTAQDYASKLQIRNSEFEMGVSPETKKKFLDLFSNPPPIDEIFRDKTTEDKSGKAPEPNLKP